MVKSEGTGRACKRLKLAIANDMMVMSFLSFIAHSLLNSKTKIIPFFLVIKGKEIGTSIFYFVYKKLFKQHHL